MSHVLFRSQRFTVVRESQTTPDGREIARDIVRHPGAVAILPLLDDGRVCLIQNHRLSVGQTLIELPAGTLEPGEDPAAAAARELTEETGYRAGRIELLAVFYMSPGILDEKMHVYVATGLTAGAQKLEPGESIVPLRASWNAVLTMLRDGRIQDAKTMAALLYYHAFCRPPTESEDNPCDG